MNEANLTTTLLKKDFFSLNIKPELNKPELEGSSAQYKTHFEKLLINPHKFNKPTKKTKYVKSEPNIKNNFQSVVIEGSLVKGDKEFIKKLYLHILENCYILSMVLYLISTLDRLAVAENIINTDQQNDIEVVVAHVEVWLRKIGFDINKQAIFKDNVDVGCTADSSLSLYDIIKVIHNTNLKFYRIYCKTEEKQFSKSDQFLTNENLDTKLYPVDGYDEFKIRKYENDCVKHELIADNFQVIRDKNRIRYSSLSKNQSLDYSFYQTICQPLIFLDQHNKNITISGKEKLTTDKPYCKGIVYKNKIYYEEENIVNNNLVEPRFKDIQFVEDIYLPKFSGYRELPYSKALLHKLLMESTYKEDEEKLLGLYITKFQKLYLGENNTSFSKPEEIAGDLDLDSQIKALEKDIKLIKNRTNKNYNILSKSLVVNDADVRQISWYNRPDKDTDLAKIDKLYKKLKIIDTYGFLYNINEFDKDRIRYSFDKRILAQKY